MPLPTGLGWPVIAAVLTHCNYRSQRGVAWSQVAWESEGLAFFPTGAGHLLMAQK